MIIFLDLDGVLIPANSWRAPEILDDGFPTFKKESVENINKIISKLKADIYLITSHKDSYSISEWESLFQKRGVKFNTISKLPKRTGRTSRKDELISWFKSNKVDDDFIIIDDDKSLNYLPKQLKKNLFQPMGAIGLTKEITEKIINHYNF